MALHVNKRRTFVLIALLLMRDLCPLGGIQGLSGEAHAERNSRLAYSTGRPAADQSGRGIPQVNNVHNNTVKNVTNIKSSNVTTSDEEREEHEVNTRLLDGSLSCTTSNLTTASVGGTDCSQDSSDMLGILRPSECLPQNVSINKDVLLTRPSFVLETGNRQPRRTTKEMRGGVDEKGGDVNPWLWRRDWDQHQQWQNKTVKWLGGRRPFNQSSEDMVATPGGIGALRRQHGEDTNVSGAVDLTATVMDDFETTTEIPEDHLIYTCAGRCGDEALFPCSCTAVCVVYHTCCENFVQDCPVTLQDGKSRFGDLLKAEVVCKYNNLFHVSSCPTHDAEEKQHRDISEPQSTTFLVAGEHLSPGSNTQTVSWLHQRTEEMSMATSNFPAGKGTEGSILSLLKAAILVAPVTDLDTGITYINSSVYNCHKHQNHSSKSLWALSVDYVYRNPQSLEDLDLNQLESLDRYVPLFDEKKLNPHVCVYDLIDTCPSTGHGDGLEDSYDVKCTDFFSLTTNQKFLSRMFRNRFCAYCHHGRTQKYQLRHQPNLSIRDRSLSMIMTFDQGGIFLIRAKSPPAFYRIKMPWSKAWCRPEPVSRLKQRAAEQNEASLTDQNGTVCTVECKDF